MAVRVCTIEANRVWTDARGSRIYCRIVFCSWGLLERIATMMVEKKPDAPFNPYNNPERLNWLIQTFDKHIDRFDSSFSSLNQKATWTLAIATGFAATSGFTKSASMITLFENGALSTDFNSDLLFIPFGLAYLVLLFQVWNVYRPQDVGFPISPLITSDLAPPVSQREDQGTYVKECLADVQRSYINLEEMEFLEKSSAGIHQRKRGSILAKSKDRQTRKSCFQASILNGFIVYDYAVSSLTYLTAFLVLCLLFFRGGPLMNQG